jgi:hypothetical protein
VHVEDTRDLSSRITQHEELAHLPVIVPDVVTSGRVKADGDEVAGRTTTIAEKGPRMDILLRLHS